MKKTILLSALLASTAQAENLQDVLNIAMEKDPQLRAAKYNQEASQEIKKQAWSNFLPQVDGSWSKNRGETDSELGIIGEIDVPDTDSRDWRVTLNQSLFDAGNLVRLKQGDLERAKGDADYDVTQQDFYIRVAQSYFDVLTNIDAVEFAKAEEKAIQRQLEQAEQRYEVGLAAITDVHEARAQYDGARASVISALNLLDDSKEALFEITQTYFPSLDALPDNIEEMQLESNDLKHWEDLALANNPTLGVSKINAELAEYNIKLQKSGHLPTLSLSLSRSNNVSGNVALRDPETQNIFATVTQERDSTSASLDLNVPIFSGGRTSSLTRQAKLQYKAAMENLDQSTFSTVRNVRNALHNVEAGWSSVQARQLAVVSAKSAEEATAAGFEVGTRNIVEVLNSQRSLYQAQRDYSRAKHDYLLNILKLKSAAGVIKADDLTAINALLSAQ